MTIIHTKAMLNALQDVKQKKYNKNLPVANFALLELKQEEFTVTTWAWVYKEETQETKKEFVSASFPAYYAQDVEYKTCIPMQTEAYNFYSDRACKHFPIIEWLKLAENTLKVEYDPKLELIYFTELDGIKSKMTIKCLDAQEFPIE